MGFFLRERIRLANSSIAILVSKGFRILFKDYRDSPWSTHNPTCSCSENMRKDPEVMLLRNLL